MEDIRYAVDGDVHIAYREVVGDPSSDATILLLSGMFIPVEAMWGDHGNARFLDGLAALGRLIVFDRRGIGMSDPVTDWSVPIYDHWLKDAVSVLDAAGVDAAHLVGWEQGGSLAMRLALTHPDRASGLVVFHSVDRLDRLNAAGFPEPEQMVESMRRWIKTGDADVLITGDPFSYATSRRGDLSMKSWLDQAGRLGASPATATRIWESILLQSSDLDLSELIPPALLLWRRDNSIWGGEVGRALAADYPDIEFVELEGEDLAPYGGDIDGLVHEIERFVHGETDRVAPADKRLSIVLFTDIVGSTQSASSIGDDAWRGMLDAHDRIVDRVVARQGGTVVKQTGDGALVLFDLASSAVRAACGLRQQLGELGMEIRQGVHAGEIVVRGDDVSGVAVHIASRIMSLAEPGEVLTSAAIPMLVEGDSFEFEPRDTATLKGLPGQREIYAIAD